MDNNTAIFKIKQLIKRLESGTYKSSDIFHSLYDLKLYMIENNLRECEKKINNVYFTFKGSRKLNVMTHDLTSVRKTLIGIKEKHTTMSRREAAARSNFFRKGCKNGAQEHCLNKYDIILAPTQGGYHYCIVTDVKKNFVECYPMTTADSAELDLLSVQYCALEHPMKIGDESPVVYLTSSRRMIPKCKASYSFVGHYFCPNEIDNALRSFSIADIERV